MTLTKKARLQPAAWDDDQPATALSADAVEVLNHIRERADLGQMMHKLRVGQELGFTGRYMTTLLREIRASVFAGQYRPKRRISIPRAVRIRVFNRDGWCCQACGERNHDLLTLGHHPVPYARGGSDHHANLRVECETCNNNLGDREAPSPDPAADPTKEGEA